MLAHRLDADGVARGVFDREILARLCGDLIAGGLCSPNGYAWFQSADHVHRDTVSLRGVIAEAIGNPDVGRGFQVCGRREVDLKMRREDSDDSRTERLPFI